MKPLLVIPMTGISSRFTAAGYDRPKFLLEVDGQTVIDHVIDMYPGWDDVVFICNPLHLDDPRWDLEQHLLSRRPGAIIVRAGEAMLGPGAAVLHAREFIPADRAVVVNYCDFTVYWDSQQLADRLQSDEVDGIIPCYTGAHPHMAHSTSYAYVKMDGDRVVDIQEKQPWTSEPLSEYASSGTYAFASGELLLRALDEQVEKGYLLSGEYYLSLTFKPVLEAGGRVEVLEIQHFMQWGTPQDFEEYKDHSAAIADWTRPRVEGSGAPASRVILASGAGARFAQAGYRVPKPLLPLSGGVVLEHALSTLPGEETIIVTRADLPGNDDVEAFAARVAATVVELPTVSRGQAESALAGLRGVRGEGPVTIGACDAIPTITRREFDEAVAAAGPDGIVPWVAWSLHAARRRPEQYGWVTGRPAITDVTIKGTPTSDDAGVMIGTFTFASAASAMRQIEALIAADERVNGEYYLDSLVRRAVESGRPAVALATRTFSSVGTPSEYEAVLYWQSCFHKWALHPYSLSGDPLVPRVARAELDSQFRSWPHLTEPTR